MHVYEADMETEALESLFETALYRFLELYSSSADSEFVAIHTEIDGVRRRKMVTLWSAEAVDRLDRHWAEFRRERTLAAPF